MSLLRLEAVTQRFGGLVALDSVSLKVEAGGVTAIIGAARGFKTQVKVQRRQSRGVLTRFGPGTPVYQDPSKIGHLLEFGHGGPHPAPAHPHLRPAFDETKGRVETLIIQECQVEIDKALAKAAGKK